VIQRVERSQVSRESVVVRAVRRKFVSDSLLEHSEKIMIIVGYESLDMLIRVVVVIRD